MNTCRCCGENLPDSAVMDELCAECVRAMEALDSSEQLEREDRALPPHFRYPVTRILIAINVCVFSTLGVLSKTTSWGNKLADVLTNFGPYTLSGQWWRPLTSDFVHFTASHLIGNIICLWILGKRAEQLFGKWTYLLLYLICGLAGNILSLAVHPALDSHGASGAIFGLAGALIGAYGTKVFKLSKSTIWKLIFLIAWTAINVFTGFSDMHVDNMAHCGGLVAGLILGGLLGTLLAGTNNHRRYRLFSASTMLLLASCPLVAHYRSDVASLKSAVENLDAGKPDEALQVINAVLQHEPENALAERLAAKAYLQKDDYDHAEAMARHILAMNQDDDEALYVLGRVAIHSGNCSAAYQLIGETAFRRGLDGAQPTQLLELVNTLGIGDKLR